MSSFSSLGILYDSMRKKAFNASRKSSRKRTSHSLFSDVQWVTIAVKPQTSHLDKAALVHLDMTILFFFFYQISCYLHLYGTFLLKLLKQFQHHNTCVNWMRRNILHLEVEMKDTNCQWLSSTEQSRARGCTKNFPESLKKKVIREGALILGSRHTDRL